MTIQLKKCSFFTDTIDYLSHVIAPNKLHVANYTIKSITVLQYPTTVSKLRSFLRLRIFYRRFVPNFAKIALPLNQKLSKGDPLQISLEEEEINAVGNLKEKLVAPPLLALPQMKSKWATHCWYWHLQCPSRVRRTTRTKKKSLKLIAYLSRSLCDAERPYDTTHKERSAVVWAVSVLRPYLEDSYFILRTDS